MFIESDNIFTLQKLTSARDKTIVMFGVNWCEQCESLKKEFVKLEPTEREKNIDFIYCDVDRNQNISELVEIEKLPTLVSFNRTNVVLKHEGKTKKDIIKTLKSLIGI